jgi:pyruvate kinase
MKRTKIICTIGPASNSLEKIIALIENGMNIARLNFSHGTHAEHAAVITTIREAIQVTGKHIAILQDLQGPKIRIGNLSKNILLKAGEKLRITTEDVIGNYEVVSTTYKEIADDVKTGDRILMDDGLLELRVISKTKTEVLTEVVIGGILKSHKGLNLPGVKVSIPSLTEKDLDDLDFGLEQNVDIVALSFVRSDMDVRDLVRKIKSKRKETWVVSKIEKPEALKNIDHIISESDAVMIARGDLGVELSTEDVPIWQKVIIAKCNALMKPVITATQMLETMTESPRPTRAEASDVANAVFDGTDVVMLSAETASGKYPVEAVRTMSQIINTVEIKSKDTHFFSVENSIFNKMEFAGRERRGHRRGMDEAISASAVQIAEDLNAKLIVVLTHSGQSAIKISKHRPVTPIVAITDKPTVVRLMNLVWGVEALLVETLFNTDESFHTIEHKLVEQGLAHVGDTVIYTLGIPLGNHGITNTIKVSSIGE